MENRILFILIFVLFFLSFSNVFASELCSSNGYTILTVNGIFTNEQGAKENRNNLKKKLPETYNNESLVIKYLYNPTHLAGAGDLIDAVQQGLFDQKSDYDLVEMINDASQKVATQKVLLVAHSQGNFYANNFYDKIASQEGGIPIPSIGVYGVASPANRVGGGGKYLTSDTDEVIASTVARFLNILSPNIHIPLSGESDGNGHSFSDVYLKYQGDKIVSDIKSSLNKLKENDEQEIEDPCISPPELSTTHKIQGVILAVADPTAVVVKGGIIVTYNAGVYVATGLYNTGKAIANTTIQIANATASSIVSLAKSLSEKAGELAGNNSAAVILADEDSTNTAQNSEPEPTKGNSSSQTKETQLPKDIAVDDSTQATVETAPVAEPIIALSKDKKENTTNNILQSMVAPSVAFYGGSVGAVGSPPPDKTGPVISVTGLNPIDVTKDTSYTEAGATALDNIDGITSVVTSGTVDIAIVGIYTITYTSTDVAGNVATTTRIVNVVAPPPFPPVLDTTPPVIALVGDGTVTVTVGGTYTDSGAIATDNIDGNITASINTINPVDVNAIDDYTITYDVKDVALNSAIQVTRIVHVVRSNVLYSQLDSSVEISLGAGAIGSFDSFTSAGGHIQGIKFAYNDYGNSAGHFIGVSVVDRTDGISYYGTMDGGQCGDAYESTGLNTKTIIELDSSVKYKAYPCTGPELTLNPAHTYGISLFRNRGGVDTQRFYGSSNSNNSVYLHITDDTFPSVGKSINSFKFTELGSIGVIDNVNHYINITVPFGTDVTALAPDIKISGGASVSPNNNVVQNFNNPVTYVVTAENGLSQLYTITVLIHSKVLYSQLDNSVEISTIGNVRLQDVFTGASGNISNLKFSYNDHGNSTGHFIGVQIIDQTTSTGYYVFKSGFGECGDAYESTGTNISTIVNLDDTYQYRQYPCTGPNLVLNPTHIYGISLFRNQGGQNTQRFYGNANTNNAAYLYIETNGVAVPDPDPGPTKLKILTSSQTIAVDTASSVITVESQNASGVLTQVASTTYVNLSSNSVTGMFASSPASGPCGDNWTKTSITISTGDAHRSFCYKDSIVGTPTITISADGLTSDSQTITIN